MFCVKNLSPYLLGKLFTVRADHKNLANSTVPKLVRWRILLSEFRFQIEHIPGSQNVVADGLTRVFHVDYKKLPQKIKYCFKACGLGRFSRPHLYSVTPLKELSIDTLGPLAEDEYGVRYIILIVDNFLKFVGLYLSLIHI